MITINKSLLKNYRFSDNPNAWAIEGKGFCHSAKLLQQSLKKPRHTQPKFVSTQEAGLGYSCNKTVCFLYAIAIELFLKALYSRSKTPEDQEKTESFNHNVIKLNQKLISKGALQADELDKEALELANIILAWSGRYYKPQPHNIDKVIESYFEQVPDQPEMVKPKFGITPETTVKLADTATLLSNKLHVNPGSIDHLLFLPF